MIFEPPPGSVEEAADAEADAESEADAEEDAVLVLPQAASTAHITTARMSARNFFIFIPPDLKFIQGC
jgi:hypothetical protein